MKREKLVNRARILVADDHDEMRDQIKRLLESEVEVVDSVENGLALLEAAAKLSPDVCLLDISMPILNGIEAATRLRHSGSTAKIVFLTDHEDPDLLQATLNAGASGYVLKWRMTLDLASAINEALAGRIFISASSALGTEPEATAELPLRGS